MVEEYGKPEYNRGSKKLRIGLPTLKVKRGCSYRAFVSLGTIPHSTLTWILK
jgi:hypothetical protein